MADERPHLRVVGPDETAPEPPPVPPEPPTAPRSAGALPLLVGVAVLVVGLAVALVLLSGGPDDGTDGTDGTAPRAAGGTTTTLDPRRLLPTIAPTSTLAPTTVPTTTPPASTAAPGATAPGAAPDGRSLTDVPVIAGTGGAAAPAPPTRGEVRVRLVNAFLPGVALDVWDTATDPPVRYGTVGSERAAEITAGGRLLPGGVELRLRFVRAGGDPTAPANPSTGPWQWNLTPAAGSSQTLVLVPNPGFRVVRIDDLRAARDTPGGQVHVVPVTFHLVLGGSRALRWAGADGCLGPRSTDDVELDLAPGSPLRLAPADDDACGTTVAGPLTVTSPGTYAVVGIDGRAPDGSAAARLVAVPLA